MAGLFNSGKSVELPPPVKLSVAPVAQTASLRPVQRDGGGNARALAAALGSLNGSLQRYVETKQAIEENPESLANREWIARAQQMSMEDLQSLAASGEADGIRVREDAMNSLLGDKAVSDARAEVTEHFSNGFDYTNGDATAEIDEIITRHAAALPNDISRAAFTRGMGGFRQAWLDKTVETKVDYAKGQVSTAIIDSFRNTIDDAQGQGKSADEVAALVFERSAGNRTFLGLSGQEQNDTVLAIAEEAAQRGDVDLVNALVNGTRKGADGKVVPPLSKIAGITAKTSRLMDVARGRQTEKIERESFPTFQTLNTQVAEGSFTAEMAEPLIANGSLTAKAAAAQVAQSDANRARIQEAEAKKQQKLAYIQTNERQRSAVLAAASHELESYAGVTNIQDVEVVSKSGEGMETFTKKQIVEAAVSHKEQSLQDKRAKLIEGGTSEGDADLIVNRDRVTFYAANGLDNDTWDMQFNNVAGMVGMDVLTKGGAPAEQLTDIAELYLQVRAVSPAYAEGTVTDPKAREFFEVYDAERNLSRLPPDRAALSAAAWVSKPETEKARFRIKNEEKAKIASDAMSSGLKEGWFGSSNPDGHSAALVQSKVEQLSRLNLPKAVIQKRTEDWIKNSTVNVNGVLVETKGRTPPDFKAVSEEYLNGLQKGIAEEEGLEDAEEGDLFLVPTPSGGRWMVWSKSRNVPLPHSIGADDLAKVRSNAAAERAKAAAERAKADDAERAKYGAGKKKERDEAAALRKETQAAQDKFAAHRDAQQAAREKARAEHDAKTKSADMAEKQAGFDAYVKEERKRISLWKKNHGKLGAWAAEGWEKDLSTFIEENDPRPMAVAARDRKQAGKKRTVAEAVTAQQRETIAAQDRFAERRAELSKAKRGTPSYRKDFDAHVKTERQAIAAWRKERGRLGAWAADQWEKDLRKFVEENSPTSSPAVRRGRD